MPLKGRRLAVEAMLIRAWKESQVVMPTPSNMP